MKIYRFEEYILLETKTGHAGHLVRIPSENIRDALLAIEAGSGWIGNALPDVSVANKWKHAVRLNKNHKLHPFTLEAHGKDAWAITNKQLDELRAAVQERQQKDAA